MDYKQLALAKKDAILADLKALIAINSAEDLTAATKEFPVGEGPVKAMKTFLDFAKRDGFDTENIDNYAGRINFGQGEKRLGVIGHMDVVPAGEGWKTNPFEMVIQDGKIYGRGAADDKGPALAAYYGMLLLKEAGFEPKKKIDFVLGTNEETNWVGINYYLKHEPWPDQAFSPDAEFPIINGEQGIVSLKLDFKEDATQGSVRLLSFKAGIATNVTPQTATAVISAGNLEAIKRDYLNFLAANDLAGSCELENGNATLTLTGQGAHASAPEVGRNAATFLGGFLDGLDFAGQAKNFLYFLSTIEHEDFKGEKLGIAHRDELMGELSSAPTMFTFEENGAVQVIDNVRYPQGTDPDQMVKAINDQFGKLLTASYDGFEEPHYVPGDDPLVKTLLKVYEDQTGEKGHEVIIGGGTYGRLFEHGVAFGAQPEGAPMVMHQANEYMKVDDLINSIGIYAQALYELTKDAD